MTCFGCGSLFESKRNTTRFCSVCRKYSCAPTYLRYCNMHVGPESFMSLIQFAELSRVNCYYCDNNRFSFRTSDGTNNYSMANIRPVCLACYSHKQSLSDLDYAQFLGSIISRIAGGTCA